MIETYGYARAGLLGNPSDGYFGKTISFALSNFRARVLLYPSARLEIKPSKVDLPVFENLEGGKGVQQQSGYGINDGGMRPAHGHRIRSGLFTGDVRERERIF